MPVRNKALWGLVAANAVSASGTRLSQIAIPWLVLTSTGSASKTGIVAFAELAPLVLAQTFGGPWVDRLGPRRVAVWCDAASALLIAMFPVLYAADALSFPAVICIVAACGFLRGPADVGHHAMVPDIIRGTKLPAERVTGLIGTTDNLAGLVGAGVGGGIVAVLGAADALALNSATFLISALILLFATNSLKSPSSRAGDKASGSTGSYWSKLREGFAYLRSDRLLLGVILLVAVTNMLNQGYSTVLLPTWAKESGNSAAIIGVLGACMGGSALLGALLATWWGPKMPRFTIYMIGFLLAGAPRWVALALGLPVPVLIGITLLAGFGAGFLNPVLSALQFERIPADLVGRVSATTLAVSWGLMPLGGLLAGFSVTLTGVGSALLLFAAIYLLATMAPAFLPQWRGMGQRRPVT
ncbi:MFS transporter [Curtobacterium sp. PhB142]|uniref:MFS transporter n=1 Tax=unclassified Curtobacterium TaxID=257496 RepID=UPI0010487F42|nr:MULTISPECIES: MFS transporter [unclassified Curtobacterium]TCL88454.1 MFS transporter [Curtobacterium sp. PhB142]TCM04183.1 MFS transporter [Curtobacterium sp. PhB134]TCU50252.1 MFS transporter [Curtobacterium sp. PhB146]